MSKKSKAFSANSANSELSQPLIEHL